MILYSSLNSFDGYSQEEIIDNIYGFCAQCKEKNIQWGNKEECPKKEQYKFTREEIINALNVCSEDASCDLCALKDVNDCMTVRNKIASEYIMNPLQNNEPLTLEQIIDAIKKKRPVFVVGYGWMIFDSVSIGHYRTFVYANDDRIFLFSNDRFYLNEVENVDN